MFFIYIYFLNNLFYFLIHYIFIHSFNLPPVITKTKNILSTHNATNHWDPHVVIDFHRLELNRVWYSWLVCLYSAQAVNLGLDGQLHFDLLHVSNFIWKCQIINYTCREVCHFSVTKRNCKYNDCFQTGFPYTPTGNLGRSCFADWDGCWNVVRQRKLSQVDHEKSFSDHVLSLINANPLQKPQQLSLYI